MNCGKLTRCCALLLTLLIGSPLYASVETNGTNGINSAGLSLPNGTSLTGAGIGIGQVEIKRSGDPTQPNGMPFDTTGSLINSSVDPEEVFFARYTNPSNPSSASGAVTFGATMNDPMGDETNGLNGEHAVWVAGVMISTDTRPPGTPEATGVATGAELYSVGHNATAKLMESAALRTQFIAQQNSGDIRAINMSFGVGPVTVVSDGNSLLTQFVDWSAAEHDVLYIASGYEGNNNPSPKDNFNGITVGASAKNGVKYRQVASLNDYSQDAVGARTSIDIIAPGHNILLASQGSTNTIRNGTSFAAPHVTGSVALLQEYGDERILNAGVPQWNPNARRHEVMKAVLMNSADKLEDTGDGNRLGMTRTVRKTGGTTWLTSPAANDITIPVDDEFGAGHLNAARALKQFRSGEQDADGADVSVIGWDYGTPTTI